MPTTAALRVQYSAKADPHKVTGAELTALVKRAMKGDTQAFEQLVANFSKDILYNLYIRLDDRNKGDLEDAAQDVIFALYTNIAKLKSPHAFYAYLSTVTHNMAQSYNQRSSKIRTEDVDEHEKAGHLRVSSTEQPEVEFERKQIIEQVASCVEKLPQKQREALYLYYYRDLSYAEIAERMNTTTSTVGTNINKAKGALKKMLEEHKEPELIRDTDVQQTTEKVLSTQALPQVTGNGAPEQLAGFALAPLMYDTFSNTVENNAFSAAGQNLTIYAQQLVASNPEVVIATATLAVPKILRVLGVAAVTVLAAVGAVFGIQALNAEIVSWDESTTYSSVVNYNPDAHIEFTGGSNSAGLLSDSSGETDADYAPAMSSSEETEHINPSSASVALDSGSAGPWRVIDVGTGTAVLEGEVIPADLSGLLAGDYTIIFSLTSEDGVSYAEVERHFFVR